MSVSVYTVADEHFFPGLVGLVSSLRVHGHKGPIVVADAGLAPAQVRALSAEAVLVPVPADLPPIYAKPVGPLEHPDDVMIFLDADMLCIRPLDDLVAQAESGIVLAAEDIGRPELSDVIRREWEERLQLGPLAQMTYVNSGFFALSRSDGVAFFTTLAECLDGVDPSQTLLRADSTLDFGLPFFLVDQDISNAILSSPQFHDRVTVLPYPSVPHAPFRGVDVLSDRSCIDQDGHKPLLLHHALQKPWSEPLPSNPYTELLVEYIHDPASPDWNQSDLPLFLRDGPVPRAARVARSIRGHVRAHARGRLGLRPYLERKAAKVRKHR